MKESRGESSKMSPPPPHPNRQVGPGRVGHLSLSTSRKEAARRFHVGLNGVKNVVVSEDGGTDTINLDQSSHKPTTHSESPAIDFHGELEMGGATWRH